MDIPHGCGRTWHRAASAYIPAGDRLANCKMIAKKRRKRGNLRCYWLALGKDAVVM